MIREHLQHDSAAGCDARPLKASITWQLDLHCNFDCRYCFPGSRASRSMPGVGRLPPPLIASRFREVGFEWHIILSGGEPFLYPGYVSLCEALTCDFSISIDTNLSQDVGAFAQRIDPSRVQWINCATHVEERSRAGESLDTFAHRFLALVEAGFPCSCSYVAYPPLLSRLPEDFARLRACGVIPYAKVFRGVFNGREYPGAYTAEQRQIIAEHSDEPVERSILSVIPSFRGRRCAAGQRFFTMDWSGLVWRCGTYRTLHRDRALGNLLEGTFRPLAAPEVCEAIVCLCPSQGREFVVIEQPGSADELVEHVET